MSIKRHEIEGIIEQVVESVIFEAFDSNFNSEEEISYALAVLKNKVDSLDVEDFDHLIDY
jgi:hypothetical protein